MFSSIISTSKEEINYKGSVRIRKYRKGELRKTEIHHNQGTWELFNLLCNALASGLGSVDRPSILDVCYLSGNNFISILSTTARVQSYSISSNESGSLTSPCSVTLSASLTSENISGVGGTSNIYYVLKNANQAVLAYLETDTPMNNFVIAADEVYIIDWTLTIGNSN